MAHTPDTAGNRTAGQLRARAEVLAEIGEREAQADTVRQFDGVLLWGRIYNRPYLRALHGQGLCLWRLGRFEQARQVFDRILAFNPNDNQGVRFIREDVLARRPWETTRERRS